LKENGYLYEETEAQWYSESEKRFLPDRYVEGTCYICGYDPARGDQCDNCGNLLDATQLINPRAKTDGSTPELKETTHFYLDLGKLQPAVVEFLEARKGHLRPNVLKQTLGQIEANPLRGRAITRDLDWGIPVPVEGWDGKRIYVWFEAVIGYLSATIEAAALSGDKDLWHNWWYAPEAKTYHFIGKDNIPFHAMMWPAQLHGAGVDFARIFEKGNKPLTLPYDVPANEFMNMEDRKISGSANWGVWGLDFLSRYDPDPLRYYLTINMPETRDSNWDWDEFVARNNNELVATWGNLANRVLSFAHRNWDGKIPEPGALAARDKAILETVRGGFKSVGELIDAVKLRAALQEAMRLASEVNRYLDEAAPWSQIKEDKEAAGTTIHTAIQTINDLKVLLSPFLPHTSQQLHRFLGYDQPLFGEQYTETVKDSLGEHTVLRYQPDGASGKWQPDEIEGGRKIEQPAPLYQKLEPSVAAEERARLGR
jgi:methionyl-tRNA synthetase